MGKPLRLILMRHAESEGNVTQDPMRQQAARNAAPEFGNRHSSLWRITDVGIAQARAAGKWLCEHGLSNFDAYFVSDYLRAIETAAYLELPTARWMITSELRERDSGLLETLSENERVKQFPLHMRQAQLSLYYGKPPDGESIAQAAARTRSWYFDVVECAHYESVIIVGHGRAIRAQRSVLEGVPSSAYAAWEKMADPNYVTHNTQIIEYARIDPADPSHILDDFGWVRSVCPWDPSLSTNEWRSLSTRAYTNHDLLVLANQVPRLVNG